MGPICPCLLSSCQKYKISYDNQAAVIEALNSTSRYLGNLLNIDNPFFEGMVNQMYPSELHLNETNTSDIESPFLD